MSEGMWDGVDATRCPHGNLLALDDRGECGCHLMLVTADNLVIHPGPYAPDSPRDVADNRRHRRGPQYPAGRVVKLVTKKKPRGRGPRGRA